MTFVLISDSVATERAAEASTRVAGAVEPDALSSSLDFPEFEITIVARPARATSVITTQSRCHCFDSSPTAIDLSSAWLSARWSAIRLSDTSLNCSTTAHSRENSISTPASAFAMAWNFPFASPAALKKMDTPFLLAKSIASRSESTSTSKGISILFKSMMGRKMPSSITPTVPSSIGLPGSQVGRYLRLSYTSFAYNL